MKTILKSMFPMKNRIYTFYRLYAVIFVFGFLYFININLKSALGFSVKYLIFGLIIIKFAAPYILSLAAGRKKYYIPQDINTDDISDKAYDALEKYGFKCRSISDCAIAIRKINSDLSYRLTLNREKGYFRVKAESKKLPMTVYRSLLKDIPIIVSTIQNSFIVNFEFSDDYYKNNKNKFWGFIITIFKLLSRLIAAVFCIFIAVSAAFYLSGAVVFYMENSREQNQTLKNEITQKIFDGS